MTFDTFFLLGSLLLLLVAVAAARASRSGPIGPAWPTASLAAACGALFLLYLSRFVRHFGVWSEGLLLMAAVTLGSLSAAAILLGLQARRDLGRGQEEPGP